MTILSSFLAKDYASARCGGPNAQVSGRFFAAEFGPDDVVTKEDAVRASERYGVTLPIGKYRQIGILSAVANHEVFLRKAFIGPSGVVFWHDGSQVMAEFVRDASCSQSHEEYLMNFGVGALSSFFAGARKGSFALDIVMTPSEAAKFVRLADVLYKVGLMRPE